MRKKKTPVGLLVTKDPVGDARETAKDYGASVASKAAASAAQLKEKANESKAPAIASFRKSLGGRPLMALAKSADYKPTPNESSTSTQWYH